MALLTDEDLGIVSTPSKSGLVSDTDLGLTPDQGQGQATPSQVDLDDPQQAQSRYADSWKNIQKRGRDFDSINRLKQDLGMQIAADIENDPKTRALPEDLKQRILTYRYFASGGTEDPVVLQHMQQSVRSNTVDPGDMIFAHKIAETAAETGIDYGNGRFKTFGGALTQSAKSGFQSATRPLGVGGKVAQAFVDKLLPGGNTAADYSAVNPENSVSQTAGNVVGGAVPILSASLVNPAAPIAVGVLQGVGSAEMEGEDKNLSTAQTATLALERGIVGGIIGLIPGGGKLTNIGRGPITGVIESFLNAAGINIASRVIDNKLETDLGLKNESDSTAFVQALKDGEQWATAGLYTAIGQLHPVADRELGVKTQERTEVGKPEPVGNVNASIARVDSVDAAKKVLSENKNYDYYVDRLDNIFVGPQEKIDQLKASTQDETPPNETAQKRLTTHSAGPVPREPSQQGPIEQPNAMQTERAQRQQADQAESQKPKTGISDSLRELARQNPGLSVKELEQLQVESEQARRLPPISPEQAQQNNDSIEFQQRFAEADAKEKADRAESEQLTQAQEEADRAGLPMGEGGVGRDSFQLPAGPQEPEVQGPERAPVDLETQSRATEIRKEYPEMSEAQSIEAAKRNIVEEENQKYQDRIEHLKADYPHLSDDAVRELDRRLNSQDLRGENLENVSQEQLQQRGEHEVEPQEPRMEVEGGLNRGEFEDVSETQTQIQPKPLEQRSNADLLKTPIQEFRDLQVTDSNINDVMASQHSLYKDGVNQEKALLTERQSNKENQTSIKTAHDLMNAYASRSGLLYTKAMEFFKAKFPDADVTDIFKFIDEAKNKGLKARETDGPSEGPVGMNSGISPENIYNLVDQGLRAGKWTAQHAVIAAHYIYGKAGNLIAATRKLISRFGEAIKPHVQEIWKNVKDYVQNFDTKRFGGVGEKTHQEYLKNRTAERDLETRGVLSRPKPEARQVNVPDAEKASPGTKMNDDASVVKPPVTTEGTTARKSASLGNVLFYNGITDRLANLAPSEKSVTKQTAYDVRTVEDLAKQGMKASSKVYDDAIRASSKIGVESTIANGVQKIPGTDAFVSNSRIAAERKNYSGFKVDPRAESLFKKNDAANLAIGQKAEEIRPGWKATGLWQRLATFQHIDMIKKGGGKVWDAWINGVLKLNPELTREKLVEYYNGIKKDLDLGDYISAYRKISQENNRGIERVPSGVTVKIAGVPKQVWMFHDQPAEYLKIARERVLNRAAFLKVFGERKVNDIRDAIDRETVGGGQLFLDVVRAIHGLPMERGLDPTSFIGTLNRAFDQTIQKLSLAMYTVGATPANLLEVIQGNNAMLWGPVKVAQGLAYIARNGRQGLEDMGYFDRLIQDYSLDPNRPVKSLIKITRNAISMPNSIANELGEVSAAATMKVVTDKAQNGRLNSFDKARLTQFARLAGFSPDVSKSIGEGTAPRTVYESLVRKTPALMTGGNIKATERSYLEGSRLFNQWFPFMSYPQMQMRLMDKTAREAYSAISDVRNGDFRPAAAKIGAFTQVWGGTAVRGVAITLISALLTGGVKGLQIAMNEQEEKGKDALTNPVSAMQFLGGLYTKGIGGPLTMIDQFVGSDKPMDLGNYSLRAKIITDLHNYLFSKGQYQNKDWYDKAAIFAQNKLPAAQIPMTWASIMGLGQRNVQLEQASKGFFRWIKDNNIELPGGGVGENDEMIHFQSVMRQAATLIRQGQDPTDYIKQNLQGMQSPEMIASSLRGQRLLTRIPKWVTQDQIDQLKRRLGQENYDTLQKYDDILSAWAGSYQQAENVSKTLGNNMAQKFINSPSKQQIDAGTRLAEVNRKIKEVDDEITRRTRSRESVQ